MQERLVTKGPGVLTDEGRENDTHKREKIQ